MPLRAYFKLDIYAVNYIYILPTDIEQPQLLGEARILPAYAQIYCVSSWSQNQS